MILYRYMDGAEIEVGGEAVIDELRENIRDLYREYPQDNDTEQITAARKYLGARHRRMSIELDSGGDKLIAFPWRLAEIRRARKLTGILDVGYESRADRDGLLPTLARMTIDKSD